MLSEPAVWGWLPSAWLLFLLLWKVFFLKTCLPINRPEDLLVGELTNTEVLLWGQSTGLRGVSANPKVPSSLSWSHALHRSELETGPHRGCSSLQVQNLALPVILVEKVKTQETEKQHLYDWRCDSIHKMPRKAIPWFSFLNLRASDVWTCTMYQPRMPLCGKFPTKSYFSVFLTS